MAYVGEKPSAPILTKLARNFVNLTMDSDSSPSPSHLSKNYQLEKIDRFLIIFFMNQHFSFRYYLI